MIRPTQWGIRLGAIARRGTPPTIELGKRYRVAAIKCQDLHSRRNPVARMSTEAWSSTLASITLLLQGRHMTVPNDVKSYVEEKMADAIIERSDLVREVDVRLSSRGDSESGPKLFRCEATLFTKKHGVLRAEEEGGNMYACVDSASRLLGKKLLKLKDKLGLHGRLRSRLRISSLDQKTTSYPANEEEIEEVVAEAEDLAVESEIVREKFFDMVPMRPEEALEEMKNIGHDFYAFRNAKTLEINVLYKRKRGGGYGLIGPTAVPQKLNEDLKET